MKKILLYVAIIFFAGYSFAQTIEDFSGTLFTTDNTGSIVWPQESLSDFVGSTIVTFVNGVKVSNPLTIIDGSNNMAIQGQSAALFHVCCGQFRAIPDIDDPGS